MDLFAYFEAKSETTVGAGQGNIAVWDLSSDSHPVIAMWTDVFISRLCISGTALRLGVVSLQTSTLSVFEVLNQALLCCIHIDTWIGRLIDVVCNVASDKIAVVANPKSVVYSVDSVRSMYELERAMGAVFSNDSRFIYVQYTHKVVQCETETGIELRSFGDETKPTVHYSFLQSSNGSDVVWLQAAMIPHFELVQLDTISGNTLSPFSCGPVRLLGMGDDGKTVFFGNECIETYDVISRNRTPTNVKVAYTMSVAVFGDIVTVFQVSSRDINAIDLATGENLYKIRLPEELLNRQEDLDWYFGGALSKNRGVILL
jgi:hypothetical protein